MSTSEGFGAITTLCGGGRYNGLVQEIGGPETPGIGFALSIERLISAMEAEKVEFPIDEAIDCYVVALGEKAKETAVKLLFDLRKAGIVAEKDYQDKKLKAQFKAADRLKAKFTIVFGDDELAKGVVSIKEMETGEQQEIAYEDVVTYLSEKKSGER
jgi:histidyl-tRNA synthetase